MKITIYDDKFNTDSKSGIPTKTSEICVHIIKQHYLNAYLLKQQLEVMVFF
jgi:hypothetical protein